MSDENTPGKTDENAAKPTTDTITSNQGMGGRVEVVVEEVFGAVSNVFEAIKDEISDHFGGSHDAKDDKDDATHEAVEVKGASAEEEAHAPTTIDEAHLASGDAVPGADSHQTDAPAPASVVSDTPDITATPVANFAFADVADPNAPASANANAPASADSATATATTETTHSDQNAAHASTDSTHADGAVVVETTVIQETIVQEADGTQHVEVVEAHEVATVVRGENGEAEVTVVDEYAIASADVVDSEIYDASAVDTGDDTFAEADYDASYDDVADYDATADTDTTDTVDNQDTLDAGDAIETHLGDMVTYD